MLHQKIKKRKPKFHVLFSNLYKTVKVNHLPPLPNTSPFFGLPSVVLDIFPKAKNISDF